MKLLLVEDDRVVRITVRDALEDAGYQVRECPDGLTALRAVEDEPFDLLLSDVRLPGLDGLALFRRARQLHPDLTVLLMTAFADFKDAVAVVREGARDYIVKPFDMEDLLARVAQVRDEHAFRKKMEAGRDAPPARRAIRGNSAVTVRLLERIAAAAASDVSVLIMGETGTGKDLCARMIHEGSRRAAGPFLAVNCAAIPENLLESELFGHEKGAFTGATSRRAGRFEAAHGGTLFLDEVGELPVAHQAKLLRAIETSTFEPVGSSRSVKVDVRIIAATNQDLPAAVAAGRFRSDLYYRLNVVDILTPPLRERRADIPELVGELLNEICTRQACPVPDLHPCVVAALATYDFPGNVRELLHALERAVALSRGTVIRLAHLPAALAAGGCGCQEAPCQDSGGVGSLEQAVERFERQYIQGVLSKVDGHRGRAASLLRISRKSLWQRLRESPDEEA